MDEPLLFKVAAIGMIAVVAACEDSLENTTRIPGAQEDSGLDASAGFDSGGSRDDAEAGASGDVSDAADEPALPVRGCAGNVTQSYDFLSGWQDGTYCAHQLCADGDCVGECTPGEFKCVEGSPSACSGSGQWVPTSLLTDPHNCSECLHDCLGGRCMEGACLPTEVFFDGPIASLAVGNAHVYWTPETSAGDPCTTSIHVRRTDGSGEVYTFPILADCEVIMAADGDDIYWIAVSEFGEQWSVNRAGSDGHHAVRLGKGTPAAKMAVHNGTVTWARSTGENASSVYQMRAAGGEAREVWSGIGRLFDLEVGDGGVVVATHDRSTDHSRVTRIGSSAEDSIVLATEPGEIWGIATDETAVYYVKPFDRTLSKVSLHGGTVAVLASELSYPLHVLVDLAAVYVVEMDKVSRIWLSGGPPELVASVGATKARMHPSGIFVQTYSPCPSRCQTQLVRLVK